MLLIYYDHVIQQLIAYGCAGAAKHRDVRERPRRALPTQRSAVPFCHGLRYAVRFGSMPRYLIASVTLSEKIESLS